MPMNELVSKRELLRELPWLSEVGFDRLRRARRIPFLKIGHRSYVYDRRKVLAALEKMTVREVNA